MGKIQQPIRLGLKMKDTKDAIVVALTIFATTKRKQSETQECREAVASMIWTLAKGKSSQMVNTCKENFDCWKYSKPPRAANDFKSREGWRACYALAEKLLEEKFVPAKLP